MLGMLAGSILMGAVSGCESVHLSGDPGRGGLLKRTTDVMAAAGIGVASTAKGSNSSDVWQDSSGTWHWTRTDHSGAVLKCEGRRLGVPTRCEKM